MPDGSDDRGPGVPLAVPLHGGAGQSVPCRDPAYALPTHQGLVDSDIWIYHGTT